MRFPNLRYGNPNEFRHYAQFIPLKQLARQLRRSERTIRNWLTEREKLPWWVPEILRLQHMEHAERMRQMNTQPVRLRLGLVSGDVIAFPQSGRVKPLDAEPLAGADDGAIARGDRTAQHAGDVEKYRVVAG